MGKKEDTEFKESVIRILDTLQEQINGLQNQIKILEMDMNKRHNEEIKKHNGYFIPRFRKMFGYK